MICPYENQECEYLILSGFNDPKECSACFHYNRGVRATGATPVLAWIMNLLNWDNWNSIYKKWIGYKVKNFKV